MVTKQKEAFMKNVTYRKHLNVHNICKSTKKKSLQLKIMTAHCFYIVCAKKRERKRHSGHRRFFSAERGTKTVVKNRTVTVLVGVASRCIAR